MNILVYTLRPEHVDYFMSTQSPATGRDIQKSVEAARESQAVYGYLAPEGLIAIVGFAPVGLFGETVYIWMYTSPLAQKYRAAVHRYGVKTLKHMMERYPRIVGHCITGSRSVNWLLRLGAQFGSPQGGLVPFVIGE